MKSFTFRIGGVHPDENKITAEIPTKEAELPKQAIFPLSQHIGAPAKPVVQKGDKVKVGTLLAEAGGFVSAPIFSSVSGTVAKIDASVDASGYRKPVIIINVEGDEWEEGIDRSDKLEKLSAHPELTPEEIVKRVRDNGIVGMGGACFPTAIKLTPPPTAKAECVIINGVECEPYITSDYRLMMEHPDEILVGVDLLMKAVKVDKGYIGIETNKPKAIELLEEKSKDYPHIRIVPLDKKYPQGGEKQLVDAVIRRQVPAPPAIPVNVGAVVQNVGTAFAVYQAVMKHKPLFERYVTVTGKKLTNPGNFLVRMGTPMSQLINACGGLPEGDNKILAGGPMMGKALPSIEVPIVKGTNSVTVLTDADAHRQEPSPCIRCAKCVSACPMGLEPYLLATLSAHQDWERDEQEDIVSCIECGSCQFTCPAHRPLLDNIRAGKQTVMGIIRERAAKAKAEAEAKKAAEEQKAAK
jgi:electron transport complex protein RnfC